MKAEPHKWRINITCPKCRHVGNVDTSFPCCEHVAELRVEVMALREENQRLAERLAEGA